MKLKVFTIVGTIIVVVIAAVILVTKNTIGSDAIRSGVHVVSSGEFESWYKALAWKDGKIDAPTFDPKKWTSCKNVNFDTQKKCITKGNEQTKYTADRLITNLWYRQEADKRNITLTSREKQDALDIFKLSKGNGQYDAFMTKTGLDKEAINGFVNDEALADKIRIDEVKKAKAPNEEDLKQQFELYPDLFKQPETKQTKIVGFVSLQKAKTAKQSLQNGNSWEKVKNQFGRKNLPLKNNFKKSQSPPSLENLIWNAKEKTIVGPQKINDNLWILFEVDRTTKAKKQSFAQARPFIIKDIAKKNRDQAIQNLNKELRESWGKRTECEEDIKSNLCSI